MYVILGSENGGVYSVWMAGNGNLTPINFTNTVFRDIRLTSNYSIYGGIIRISASPSIVIFQNCSLSLAKVFFLILILFHYREHMVEE
jgi:hypothetical protein